MKEYPELDLIDFLQFIKTRWKLLIVIFIFLLPIAIFCGLKQKSNYVVETAYFFPVKHYGYEKQKITKDFVLELIDNQNFYSKLLKSNSEIDFQSFYPKMKSNDIVKLLKKQISYEFSPSNFLIITVVTKNESLSKLLANAFIKTLNSEINNFVLNVNKKDIVAFENQLIYYKKTTDSLKFKLISLEKELEKNPGLNQYQIFSISEELNNNKELIKTIEFEKAKLTYSDFSFIEIEKPYYIKVNFTSSFTKLIFTAIIISILLHITILLLLYIYQHNHKSNL